MGKRELKKQYNIFDKSIIDYVSMIDLSTTNKLTPFLLKLLNNNLNENKKVIKIGEGINKVCNRLDRVIIDHIINMSVGGKENLDEVIKFNNHLDNNRIEQKDILQYNTIEDILTQNGIVEIKLLDKELTKQVLKIYEDSEWLVVKPLSFKASLAYGSGTRWCTAIKNEPSYFYRYANKGILLYVINKINHKKYGFFSSELEFSVWNAIDNRIDSMETKIPFEILSIISDNCKLSLNPKNYELFSENESLNRNKVYFGEEEIELIMEQPIELMEVDPYYYGNTEENVLFEEDNAQQEFIEDDQYWDTEILVDNYTNLIEGE